MLGDHKEESRCPVEACTNTVFGIRLLPSAKNPSYAKFKLEREVEARAAFFEDASDFEETDIFTLDVGEDTVNLVIPDNNKIRALLLEDERFEIAR